MIVLDISTSPDMNTRGLRGAVGDVCTAITRVYMTPDVFILMGRV
jgi:hypothetical protein